jgi:hypothetical protein
LDVCDLCVGHQELAKKKAIDETVRTAAAKAAPIEEFPSFLKYERNGLNLQLEADLAEYGGTLWI